MELPYTLLGHSPLFADIDEADLGVMLSCLSARKKSYPKNAFLFEMGDHATSIGILLSGSAHVMKEDFWGNRSILTYLGPGELFGESFSCAEVDRLPIGVLATEKAEALLLDYRKVINTCSPTCTFHARLIQNMLRIIAQRNVQLTQKIDHISQRTTRQKLLSYLSNEALRVGSSHFTIPFNRQELADYLSIDRSAMSSELGKMRDEGLLHFSRNQFELLE